MQEIPFAIPLTGIIRVVNGEISIVVNRTETSLKLAVEEATSRRRVLEEGVTLNDIALEAARELVAGRGYNRFRAAEIFHKALEKHPGIKRNSLMSRIVACTPDHPSNKYFASRRDFFRYGGSGILLLNEQYMPDKNIAGVPSQSR
jgi:hypothetical protein